MAHELAYADQEERRKKVCEKRLYGGPQVHTKFKSLTTNSDQFKSLTPNSNYSHRMQITHTEFKSLTDLMQISHTEFKSLTPNANHSHRIQITHT